MSTLRISDAPLLPDVDGTEKIPTGGRGDYAISVDQIKDHIFQNIGKELVGLGNVDNTSDLDKPVSTAQQAALDLKADKTYVDTNLNLKADKTNVYTRSETSLALSKKADLVNGVVPESQIPSSFNDVLEFTTPNLPIIGESGKIYVTTDTNKTWRWATNRYVEISGWNPDSVSKAATIPTYNNDVDGVDPVTGVAEGAYFNVRSTDDDTMLVEYQNVDGVPTLSGKSYPSAGYVQSVAEFTALPFVPSESYGANRRVQLANGDIVKSTVPNNTVNPNVDMTGWIPINDTSQIFDSNRAESQEYINSASPKYDKEATFPIVFASDQYFYGKGRRALTLNVPATSNGFVFHPASTARNALKGVHLFSDGQTRTLGTVGVNTSDSSFAIVDDVRITGFDVGIVDNETPNTSSFSARNSYREVEVNNCNTGVKAYGANANSYSFGRVWNCNIGFDLNDAEAITLIGENIESCKTSIKTNKSAFINLFGGYLESGVGNKNFELDKETSISAYGVKVNGVRGFDECYDPNLSEWHFDAKDTANTKSRLSFIPAASNQYIRNTDFSMGLFGWSTSGLATTIQSTDFESASRAVLLTPSATNQYFQQAFNIERDAKKISIAVRFKPKAAGTFRINVLQGATIVGQYTYVSAAESAEFLTATVTPAITDTTQPITVRIYPDAAGGSAPVVIDQAWAVRGYFVSAPRRYENSTVLLDSPKTLVGKTVTANTTDVIAPTDIPTGAKGLRVRIIVTATLAETNLTYVHINGVDAQVTALKNNQKFVGEFTIVGTSSLDIRALVGSASNSVTYKVEVVEWII